MVLREEARRQRRVPWEWRAGAGVREPCIWNAWVSGQGQVQGEMVKGHQDSDFESLLSGAGDKYKI